MNLKNVNHNYLIPICDAHLTFCYVHKTIDILKTDTKHSHKKSQRHNSNTTRAKPNTIFYANPIKFSVANLFFEFSRSDITSTVNSQIFPGSSTLSLLVGVPLLGVLFASVRPFHMDFDRRLKIGKLQEGF